MNQKNIPYFIKLLVEGLALPNVMKVTNLKIHRPVLMHSENIPLK